MDILIEGVGKRFDGVAALSPIDLAIPSGQLVALLGPSGSGKTTLLRLIAGLLPVDGGRIRFGDNDATRLSLRDRRVGFVFQHYALFPHMSVFENVAFGLRSQPRRQRPAEATIRKKVDDLLELVQIAALRDRLPAQLSGGQRQRVALARAMAIDPTVLLLDEPFGALDAKVRIELRRWLRTLHDETGLTTVFVTHDQEEALELADRVVVMNQGAIVQDDVPERVYSHPASPFVFDFIGRSNQIEGEVRDGLFFAAGMSTPLTSDDCPVGPATLYSRPHDLRLSESGKGLQAKVLEVRRLAGRVTLEAALAGQTRPLVMDLSSHDLLALPAAGERIGLSLQHYRVFAAAR
ncbi:MAG TPA: sulfate/molybdate ABC transporter ATP-binding protein [Arenimonas sp.]|uniref:sulfate/molybdate ABC transporter ATP-binding protein n=1 Tax=Arenimonas sp. TaxID=1872635 RepID=UPI002CB7B945|nr:sulfate/molybdate ABC transporter ATP-binding protein [Arenimonas sp.]HMB56607.1 sulfate/molybdate ABC transporter ATP-binding protein [Arenimonas sp.]